jgi:hypothetical protein
MTDDEIIGELVGKYYTMDAATEKLLFQGKELQNGMTCLVAPSTWRRTLVENPGEEELELILQRNRWFVVSHLEVTNLSVAFIATYSDGHMVKWEMVNSIPWYVKLDSIPVEPEPAYRSGVIVGQYSARDNIDGTTSIYITEQDGAFTEFIVGAFSGRDVVSQLLDKTLPPVNLKHLFQDTNNQARISRNDPAWAIQNLSRRHNPTPPSAKDFGWAEDPDATRTDIPVYKEPVIEEIDPEHETLVLPLKDQTRCTSTMNGLVDPRIVRRCAKDLGHVEQGDLDHMSKNGVKWTENPQPVVKCGFTWNNTALGGVERIYICADPAGHKSPLHVDATGSQYHE